MTAEPSVSTLIVCSSSKLSSIFPSISIWTSSWSDFHSQLLSYLRLNNWSSPDFQFLTSPCVPSRQIVDLILIKWQDEMTRWLLWRDDVFLVLFFYFSRTFRIFSYFIRIFYIFVPDIPVGTEYRNIPPYLLFNNTIPVIGYINISTLCLN